MSRLHYFAYGSNMSTRRLGERIHSARALTISTLAGHQLCWHKLGRDGSGKCDAFYTGEKVDRVMGVLYEIALSDRPLLDQFEGVGAGYEVASVELVLPTGEQQQAFTYRATRIDSSFLPYHWYKEHVLQGAREHALPDAYIEQLESVVSMEDIDRLRHTRELLIYC
ncbi:MAG: gamma-glutamylcyclotransferase [Sedimenticola sp.]|nr:gamma-glutamylcyclotransferase [Sedimenticola sp.]MCW8947955.1 gamma-glutamylcyclotransferase [Sedimenticola sp.]MCW8974247.1 gamma-glutamylcyclotransferase [Sedimenticola sp.]MCW9021895.1 gamma-glutamylcyclotransferase [Sedimenticola sp.]